MSAEKPNAPVTMRERANREDERCAAHQQLTVGTGNAKNPRELPATVTIKRTSSKWSEGHIIMSGLT
jgi:hypothetical protein